MPDQHTPLLPTNTLDLDRIAAQEERFNCFLEPAMRRAFFICVGMLLIAGAFYSLANPGSSCENSSSLLSQSFFQNKSALQVDSSTCELTVRIAAFVAGLGGIATLVSQCTGDTAREDTPGPNVP